MVAAVHLHTTGHDVTLWPGLDHEGNIIDYGERPGPGWGCRTCDPDLFEEATT